MASRCGRDAARRRVSRPRTRSRSDGSRTTAARDVLGTGVAHARCDGVVLTVQQRSRLSRARDERSDARRGRGRGARARRHGASAVACRVRAAASTVESAATGSRRGHRRDAAGARRRDDERDKGSSSRIVYAASLIDIDDALVWSVAAGRDLEQRIAARAPRADPRRVERHAPDRQRGRTRRGPAASTIRTSPTIRSSTRARRRLDADDAGRVRRRRAPDRARAVRRRDRRSTRPCARC